MWVDLERTGDVGKLPLLPVVPDTCGALITRDHSRSKSRSHTRWISVESAINYDPNCHPPLALPTDFHALPMSQDQPGCFPVRTFLKSTFRRRAKKHLAHAQESERGDGKLRALDFRSTSKSPVHHGGEHGELDVSLSRLARILS